MKINKKILLPVSLALVATLIIAGVTVAFLKITGNSIENSFNAGTVGCEIQEDITSEPGVKKDVKVFNSGSAAAYVRATLAISWVDAEGNFCNKTPVEGVDYTIDLPEEWEWVKETDGFIFYCKSPVKSKTATPVLFESIKPVAEKTPDGYSLNVEILGSSIQSLPVADVESEWGVTIDDNGSITAE